MIKETTEDNYRIYIYSYGIISVLLVLKFFEHVQEFEECQKIINAIEKQSDTLGIKLPKEINNIVIDDVIDEWMITCRQGMDSVTLLSNSLYYAEVILDELQDKYNLKEREKILNK